MGSMTRRLRRAREDRRNGKLVGATGAQGRRKFAAGVRGAFATMNGLRALNGTRSPWLIGSMSQFKRIANNWVTWMRRAA